MTSEVNNQSCHYNSDVFFYMVSECHVRNTRYGLEDKWCWCDVFGCDGDGCHHHFVLSTLQWLPKSDVIICIARPWYGRTPHTSQSLLLKFPLLFQVLATIHASLYYIQPVYNPSGVHFNDKFVNECTLLCMFWSALFPGLHLTFYPTPMENERGYALVMSMFKQHSGIERIFLYPLPIQSRKLLATHLPMSFVEDIQCIW